MTSGLTLNLLLAALCTFALGTFICSRIISWPSSILVSFVKTSLPLLYFAFFFNESWQLIDGVKYFLSGQFLLSEGYTPLSIFDGEALLYSVSVEGGHHILYDWYNLVAQWLFGEAYFAPVFLNVSLTFFSGYLLFKIAITSKFSKNYCKGLFLFFILHWELLSWSTIVNLKDTFVLFLTVVSFYSTIQFMYFKKIRYLFFLGFSFFLFFWVRFYIPVLMSISAIFYLLPGLKGRSRVFFIFGIILFGGAYGSVMGLSELLDGFHKLNLGFDTILGTFKIMIIPRPWSLDPEYSFLLIASILHWIFLVPAVIGIIYLWRENKVLRLLFIYFFITILFYGAFEELQGARQRIQILFIYGWAQYHFLWNFFRFLLLSENNKLQNLVSTY